jgi:tripartite-type tricarboxylate transporter receptor subunit TctC
MLLRRRFLYLSGAAAASAACPRLAAAADTYPSRPLRWVVPFPAGGNTDLIARLMGEWLAKRLGQPVIIVYKPGEGTNTGVQEVAHELADGYTLLFATATNAINPSLYKALPFDFQRDIAPVAGLTEVPLVVAVNPSLPAKTLLQFIAEAKAHPGTINFASIGTRNIGHLAIELIKMSAGIDVRHVPYESGTEMLSDLFDGRVQACIAALPGSLPHMESGDMRALAVLSGKRAAGAPNLPIVGETLPGFAVAPWTAVGVPSRTPAAIVERLNREINAGLADPGIKASITEIGATPLIYTPAELRALIAHDVAVWAKVTEHAGIEPE